VDLSQLQMVIAGYILQLGTCHYTTVCMGVAYLHKLMSCLCPRYEAAFL
jgi:hypothetical protein